MFFKGKNQDNSRTWGRFFFYHQKHLNSPLRDCSALIIAIWFILSPTVDCYFPVLGWTVSLWNLCLSETLEYDLIEKWELCRCNLLRWGQTGWGGGAKSNDKRPCTKAVWTHIETHREKAMWGPGRDRTDAAVSQGTPRLAAPRREERGPNRLPLTASWRNQPCGHLDFALQASRTVKD